MEGYKFIHSFIGYRVLRKIFGLERDEGSD
jgi:hypothetical protein